MIFVTVGMHEQPFDRLVEYMDNWAAEYEEEVFIQTGYSTYKPKTAKWKHTYSRQEIARAIDKARIVITHGGPASYISVIQDGKIPIVVPRQKKFGEHVNNHQVYFSREVAKQQGNIIVVEDVSKLGDVIENYDSLAAKIRRTMVPNNEQFCVGLEKIINNLVNNRDNDRENNQVLK